YSSTAVAPVRGGSIGHKRCTGVDSFKDVLKMHLKTATGKPHETRPPPRPPLQGTPSRPAPRAPSDRRRGGRRTALAVRRAGGALRRRGRDAGAAARRSWPRRSRPPAVPRARGARHAVRRRPARRAGNRGGQGADRACALRGARTVPARRDAVHASPGMTPTVVALFSSP